MLVASDDPSELVPLEEVERRYIARVMEAVGGNKTAAARILGIERKRLYRMLDRLAGGGAEAPFLSGRRIARRVEGLPLAVGKRP